MSQEQVVRQVDSVSLELSPLRATPEDFYLSRHALRCTPGTLTHYRYSAGKWVEWLACQGLMDPKHVIAAHARDWLGQQTDRLKDTSLHARGQGVRTFVRFLHTDGHMPELVKFAMPRLEKRRLPSLASPSPLEALVPCSPDTGNRPALRVSVSRLSGARVVLVPFRLRGRQHTSRG